MSESAHERWTAAGRCPSISRDKAWCNGKLRHEGDHWAPYRRQDGGTTKVTWRSAEEYPVRRQQ